MSGTFPHVNAVTCHECARLCVHTKVHSADASPPAPNTRTHAHPHSGGAGRTAQPVLSLRALQPPSSALLPSACRCSAPSRSLLLLFSTSLLSFFDVTPPRARRHQREHTSKLLGARRHTSAASCLYAFQSKGHSAALQKLDPFWKTSTHKTGVQVKISQLIQPRQV